MNPGFSCFDRAASRIESCFQGGLGPYNRCVDRIFTSIARKGVWLLLAGLLALGANQTFAGAPLLQEHRAAGEAHNGWRAQQSGPADQVSRDRPGDRPAERMLCLLACMALGAQVDVLFVELPPQSSPRAEPMRRATPLGKTQARPRPNPGPPRPGLSA